MEKLINEYLGELKQATEIKKGFSFDKKYIIELTNGTKYFIKVCDSKEAPRKEVEMNYMKQLEERGVIMASPIIFLRGDKECIQVFRYI